MPQAYILIIKLMMENCFWPFSSPWFDSRIASWDLWRNKEEWRTGCQREILVFDHKIWYICSGLLQYEDQRWVWSVMSVRTDHWQTYRGAGEVLKNYSRKRKLNEKNSCTPINPKKYSCYGLKKIHTKTLITKKNSCGTKILINLIWRKVNLL